MPFPHKISLLASIATGVAGQSTCHAIKSAYQDSSCCNSNLQQTTSYTVAALPPSTPQVFEYDCSSVTRLPPQSQVTWDINTVTFGVGDLGNGAYSLIDTTANIAEIGRTGGAAPTGGGFVVTPGGIVVVEAFMNAQAACQSRNLIQQTAPGIPIKYVMCTSNHGDHCYASSVFNAPGVKFVMHQNNYLRLSDPHFLAGDKTFMMNAFGYNGDIQNSVPVTPNMEFLLLGNADMEIQLGGDTIVFKYFGPMQTPGDVMLWHPRSKTLYCGNPIIAGNGPTVPWLLDGEAHGSHQAYTNLKNFLDSQTTPSQVVPGHGIVFQAVPGATNTVFTTMIDYLAELQTKASQAVAQGMTLAQATPYMQMPAHNGYSLYSWVQDSINIPFAFVEAGGKLASGETCGQVCYPPQGHVRNINGTNTCNFCASGVCNPALGPDSWYVMGQCA